MEEKADGFQGIFPETWKTVEVGLLQYAAFSDQLLSLALGDMHLRFLCVFSWSEGSFLYSTE